jgi:ABC-type dipeptide/oligopeptide/nickel transport system ATPase component
MVISESGSGKSYLIETVARLMPSEDVVSITSLSDQALNYLPEDAFFTSSSSWERRFTANRLNFRYGKCFRPMKLSRLVTLKDPKTGTEKLDGEKKSTGRLGDEHHEPSGKP